MSWEITYGFRSSAHLMFKDKNLLTKVCINLHVHLLYNIDLYLNIFGYDHMHRIQKSLEWYIGITSNTSYWFMDREHGILVSTCYNVTLVIIAGGFGCYTIPPLYLPNVLMLRTVKYAYASFEIHNIILL